jgi:hypothetical protein
MQRNTISELEAPYKSWSPNFISYNRMYAKRGTAVKLPCYAKGDAHAHGERYYSTSKACAITS